MLSMAEYKKIIADRPEKASAADVNFRMKALEPQKSCSDCFHFYSGPTAKRNVCELTTGPDPESRHIPREADCDYWTNDGKVFPLLGRKKPSRVGRQKPAWEPTY